MVSCEFRFAAVNRSFHGHAVYRIDSIQNKEFELRLRRRLEAIAHRGNVGVEAAADILDIEHERIEIFQLFRSRNAPNSIEAVDRQASFLINPVRHLFVQLPANTVLRTEKDFQFYSWSL